jgi:NAD(P)H-nitrite reductase large subunit
MKVVIVGAGPAGVSVAETVRAHDAAADLLMLTAEPYPPYSPPAMADHFLTGSRAHLWRGDDWPERLGIDYRSGVSVVAVEADHHRLLTAAGETLAYDRLVIATGSRLYAPLAGADLPGIDNFKSLTAAEALIRRVRAREARTAVIVGAGFIGVEIALLLRALGVAVTQIEKLEQVMPAVLDRETAALVAARMRQQGVDLRLNTEATAFAGDSRVRGVVVNSGELLEADIFIAATGVRPNLELLAGSDIVRRWGLTVDDHLRTSAPDIYAAGDVVEAEDRLTGEPYVHAIFPNAVAQGRIVGLNLLGHDVAYEGAERLNSLKHLGIPIVAAGLKEGDEVLRARWDGTRRTLYLQDNRLVGFQLVDDMRVAGVLQALLVRRQDLRPLKDQLLRPTFAQGTVVASALAA